jgi:hypothetical protein
MARGEASKNVSEKKKEEKGEKGRTTASVRCCPSTKTSIVLRCEEGPRWRASSFITCQSGALYSCEHVVERGEG